VVGCNGTAFLVAWSERAMSAYSSRIRGVLLGPDGRPAATAFADQLAFRVGAKDQVGKVFPHGNLVAAAGRFALFTVSGYGHGAKFHPAIVFHFEADGAAANAEYPLDLDPYEMAFNIQGVPLADRFFAVWEGIASEDRGDYHSSPQHGVFATRVDAAVEHAVDFEAPLVVADTPAGEYNPAAAAMAGTYVLVVYEEDNLQDGEAGEHVLKAKLVTLGDGGWVEPDGGLEATPDGGSTPGLDNTERSAEDGCSCRLTLGNGAATAHFVAAILCALTILLVSRRHRS
jgi:hypothetical protein